MSNVLTLEELTKRLRRIELLTNTKTTESEIFGATDPNFLNQPKYNGTTLVTVDEVEGLVSGITRGTAGATGPQGPPGVAGTAISSYGYVYNLATGANSTVAGNTDLPFSNNGPLESITHATGMTTVTIPSAGTYKIEYNVSTTAGVGAAIAISINGATPNSSTKVPILVATGQTSGTCILTFAAGDFLTLRNYSLNSLTMVEEPSVGAQLSIIQLTASSWT